MISYSIIFIMFQVADFEPELEDSEYLSGVGGSERSKLRIKNADLDEDSRYAGKKISRSRIAKQRGEEVEDTDVDLREQAAAELGHMFEGADEEDESEEEEGDEDEEEGDEDEEEGDDDEGWEVEDGGKEENNKNGFVFDKETDFSQYGDLEEEEDSEGSEQEGEKEAEVDSDQEDDEEADSEVEEDEENLLRKNGLSEEVEKGKAVQHQLKVWDKLLETRIQQQKLLTRINRLPVDPYWSQLCSEGDGEFKTQVTETQKSLKLLLNELFELEAVLVNSEAEEPPRKKKKLTEFSDTLIQNHQEYKPERNEIIQKWSDKTRIASGKNSFSSMETSTVLQIDQILANPARLIARTKLKRTNYQTIGRSGEMAENEMNETDPDIFDDDDFYHQLLRDLIDRKTNSSSDQSQVWNT